MSQILIDDAGDLVRTGGAFSRVSEVDEIVQHVTTRVRLIRGEIPWRLDLGIPWFESILGKGRDVSEAVDLIRAAIEGTPGVLEVDSVDVAEDAGERSLTVSWSARYSTTDLARRIPRHDQITIDLGGWAE